MPGVGHKGGFFLHQIGKMQLNVRNSHTSKKMNKSIGKECIRIGENLSLEEIREGFKE